MTNKIEWYNLPKEILDQVCTCNDRFSNEAWWRSGYDYNNRGYYLHKSGKGRPCGKPSRFSAVCICEGCGNICVPVIPPYKLAGTMEDILCADCYVLMNGALPT